MAERVVARVRLRITRSERGWRSRFLGDPPLHICERVLQHMELVVAQADPEQPVYLLLDVGEDSVGVHTRFVVPRRTCGRFEPKCGAAAEFVVEDENGQSFACAEHVGGRRSKLIERFWETVFCSIVGATFGVNPLVAQVLRDAAHDVGMAAPCPEWANWWGVFEAISRIERFEADLADLQRLRLLAIASGLAWDRMFPEVRP